MIAPTGVTTPGVVRPVAAGIDDHAAAQILDRNSAMSLVCRPTAVAPNTVAIERTPVWPTLRPDIGCATALYPSIRCECSLWRTRSARVALAHHSCPRLRARRVVAIAIMVPTATVVDTAADPVASQQFSTRRTRIAILQCLEPAVDLANPVVAMPVAAIISAVVVRRVPGKEAEGISRVTRAVTVPRVTEPERGVPKRVNRPVVAKHPARIRVIQRLVEAHINRIRVVVLAEIEIVERPVRVNGRIDPLISISSARMDAAVAVLRGIAVVDTGVRIVRLVISRTSGERHRHHGQSRQPKAGFDICGSLVHVWTVAHADKWKLNREPNAYQVGARGKVNFGPCRLPTNPRST